MVSWQSRRAYDANSEEHVGYDFVFADLPIYKIRRLAKGVWRVSSCLPNGFTPLDKDVNSSSFLLHAHVIQELKTLAVFHFEKHVLPKLMAVLK